jgi:AraC-like DNA-binding protein
LYQTFDIFFNLAYLQKIAGYSDTLSKFLELVEQKQPGSLSPVDRYLTPSMISIITDVLKCDFNDRLNRFYIECKVKELLILMLGHIEERPANSPIKLNEYDVECLYQVKDLLLADFEQKLSLKELSRKAGVNEFKLKKGFKYLFGDSVFAYRHGIRMEKAKIILLETKLPVHDIAYMTGFEYPENFQKAYKKYWGVTPAEVRKGGR